MKRFLLTAAALALLTTAVQAAPKMPVHFHGSWCASDGDEHLTRCGDDDGGYHFTADGFSVSDYDCRLLTLTPHPGQGYDAMFQCEGGAHAKPYRRKYWIGFDSSLLFMRDAK